MVAFLTLLLALTSGPHPVEVIASGDAERIVLLLDGELVGEVAGARGVAIIDFGPLAPHSLEAVALDEAGEEIARTRQRVNVPKGVASVDLVVERRREGLPTVFRIVAESVWPAELTDREARLNGGELPVSPEGRVHLPSYDPQAVQLLQVWVGFSSGVTARAEVAFGGGFGEKVETRLTAVPLVRTGRSAPSPQTLGAALEEDGRPLTVAAVDAGPGDLVLVRDQQSQEVLGRWIQETVQRYWRRRLRGPRDLLPLAAGTRVRFVWPLLTANAASAQDGFSMGEPVDAGEVGLFATLAELERPVLPQPITDSVAVAGLMAAESERPRGVVLLLDPTTPDSSEHSPCEVRSYLARLGVPLLVWGTGDSGEVDSTWGVVRRLESWGDLRAAVADLDRSLASQVTAWVEGDVGVEDVAIASDVAGLEIAGTSDFAPPCR